MDEQEKQELKKQILKSAEVLTETALNELVALAELYAEASSSPIDDGVVEGVKMLKKAFLDDLVDKIDGEEG